MPQKALLKPGKKIEKKKAVANRHGKLSITKKGRFEKPPKDKKKLAVYMENKVSLAGGPLHLHRAACSALGCFGY